MIRLVMIASQLLLALFLGYWLFSQFSDQKKLLVEDLERGFRNSEQQVIDTMIAAKLIDPFLKDSSKFVFYRFDSSGANLREMPPEFDYTSDSAAKLVMHITHSMDDEAGENPPAPHQLKTIGITVMDSLLDNQARQLRIQTQADSHKQILFQSVKMFINTVGKYAEEEGNMTAVFYANIDSLLLKKLFNGFIHDRYSGFRTRWSASDADESASDKRGRIFLTSHFCDRPYGIYITHYHTYLLQSISPQIMFALLLLLITGIAFRMAYINLKSQQKLLVLKNDFISNISHELKTPVATVKVALEALLDFNMNADPNLSKSYLEMAHSEMNRLDLLVNQVLNNAALEEGNQFIHPEELNLASLVNDVLLTMKARFITQEVVCDFQPEKEAIIVNADPLHIQGVLLNLIDNSLKYTASSPRLSIHLSQDDQETLLRIRDHGIGIPEEYIEKVFDKFFRVPTGDRHNVKGYGLGLNYAALVMRHHGGTISVSNCSDGGCEFMLHFPKHSS